MAVTEDQEPLLPSESVTEIPGSEDAEPFTLALFISESRTLLSLAWPVIISYLLVYTLNIASVFSLGHIGTTELAAIALATMLVNVTGFSVGMGMASAMDTLCSQGFTGSCDKFALGKHLQRGIVVMAIISIPISILWCYTEPLLLSVGQDAAISKMSGDLILYFIPGLFPYLTQGIMKPIMYITLIASPVNMYLQWLLVWSSWSVGVIGAPIATSLINIMIMLMTIFYIKYFEGGEAYGGWEWKEALDIQQIVIFVKGVLGNNILAAQTIIINTTSLFYMNSIGAAIATSTRIGNCLGASQVHTARHVAHTALILSFCVGIFNCTLIQIVRLQWGYLFTSDPAVIEIVVDVLHLAAFFQLADSVGATCGGILRGCGRQNLGAAMNLTAYYIIGLPLSLLLTFYFHLGIMGLWLGLIVGQISTMCFALVVIGRTDWGEMVRDAQKLIGDQGEIFLARGLEYVSIRE